MSNLNFNAVLRQTEISRSNRDFLCTEEHGFFCVRRREVAFDDRPIQFSGRNGLVDCIMRIVRRADRCSRLIGVNVRCRVVFVVNLDLALQVFRNHQFNRVHSVVIFESFCVVPAVNTGNRNCGLMDVHTNVERKLGIVLAVSRDKLCREWSAVRLRCAVVNGRVADILRRIHPFKVTVNRCFGFIASSNYRTAGEAEVAELHAIVRIGRSAGRQKQRKGILIRSRSCYNSLVCTGKSALLDCDRLRLTAIDRDGQRLGVKHMVLVRFQPDHDAVKRARLKLLLGIKRIAIGIRALIAGIAHRKAGSRRLDVQVKDSLTLGKTRDRCNGRGDLLLGDREGCVLNSHALIDSAVVSIRLSSDSIGTSICCSNIQFIAVVDNEASSVVAFCILHLEGDEAGDVLVGGRRCAQSEHFVAAVYNFILADRGSSKRGGSALYHADIVCMNFRKINTCNVARCRIDFLGS